MILDSWPKTCGRQNGLDLFGGRTGMNAAPYHLSCKGYWSRWRMGRYKQMTGNTPASAMELWLDVFFTKNPVPVTVEAKERMGTLNRLNKLFKKTQIVYAVSGI